jgi:hypothetical protein
MRNLSGCISLYIAGSQSREGKIKRFVVGPFPFSKGKVFFDSFLYVELSVLLCILYALKYWSCVSYAFFWIAASRSFKFSVWLIWQKMLNFIKLLVIWTR